MNRFDEWNNLKQNLNSKNGKKLFIKDADIWWCSLGNNIKTEINGKGINFRRPILVLKKLSGTEVVAIPLSTKIKKGSWFYNYDLHGVRYTALLNQIRMVNVARLTVKNGQLDEKDFTDLKNKLRKLLNL